MVAVLGPIRNVKLPFTEPRYEMIAPKVQRYGDAGRKRSWLGGIPRRSIVESTASGSSFTAIGPTQNRNLHRRLARFKAMFLSLPGT